MMTLNDFLSVTSVNINFESDSCVQVLDYSTDCHYRNGPDGFLTLGGDPTELEWGDLGIREVRWIDFNGNLIEIYLA